MKKALCAIVHAERIYAKPHLFCFLIIRLQVMGGSSTKNINAQDIRYIFLLLDQAVGMVKK